jgi:hypothetical protein
MAKTIKITFYNPKELWIKFCNWVFWPRHKKCATWCDYYDGVLDSMIVKILQDENGKGTISDETAERLEIALKHANYQVSKQTAELMSEQYKYED